MNEEGLMNVKNGLARVEGLTDRFLTRTNILLDEIATLTQALERSALADSLSARTSFSTSEAAQLVNSIVRRI